jgi:hypothetical protein
MNKKMNMNKLKSVVLGVMIVSLATACGNGKTANPVIPGVQGPDVTYVNGNFMMSLVLSQVTLQGGGTIPIPHMPNSSFEISPDLQSAGTLVAVSLSATDIAALTGSNLLDPTELPGNRPLPGVASGALPAIAVQVPQWDSMVFYVGPNIFGVFVPVTTGLPAGYGIDASLYNTSGTQVGLIGGYGPDTTGKNAGIVVLIPIKGAVADIVNSARKN